MNTAKNTDKKWINNCIYSFSCIVCIILILLSLCVVYCNSKSAITFIKALYDTSIEFELYDIIKIISLPILIRITIKITEVFVVSLTCIRRLNTKNSNNETKNMEEDKVDCIGKIYIPANSVIPKLIWDHEKGWVRYEPDLDSGNVSYGAQCTAVPIDTYTNSVYSACAESYGRKKRRKTEVKKALYESECEHEHPKTSGI